VSRRPTRGAVLAVGTSLLTALAVATFIAVRPSLSVLETVALVMLAFAAWATAVVTTRALHDPRIVVGLVAAVVLVALATPPRESHDLWGYAEYGRIVSVHGGNPYVDVPGDFPHDPLLGHMGRGYWHTRSPYGPVFTAISAAGTAVTGDGTLPTRLFFQGIEALAVAAVLVLLWRRTRRVDALVWFGLNPLVLASLVNGGHNDGLVALGVLGGVLLASDRRCASAGVALGLATLVKLPAGLAILGLVVWLARRPNGRGDALRTAVAGGVTVLAGYLVVGTAAVRALGDSGDLISRSSVWSAVTDVVTLRADIVDALPTVALGAVLAVALLLAWAWSREADPADSTAGAASAFAFTSSYVLPWYATWGLGALGTKRPTRLAWIVAALGAAVLLAYQLPHHATEQANGAFVHVLVTDVLPVALLVAVIAIAVQTMRSTPTASTSALVTPP
jgi:hypothetical protein